MTRDYILNVARACIGTQENTDRHKTIVDIYNQYPNKSRQYKLSMHDPWCAAFVSAVFIAAGAPAMIPIECSCWMMKQAGENRGMLRDKDRYIPKPGDIIFYRWSGKKQTSHVGLVESIKGSSLKVIEGNFNDKVGVRQIRLSYPYIDSYLEVEYD